MSESFVNVQKNGWSPRLLRLIDRLFSRARRSLEREKGVAEEEGSVAAVFVVVSWVLQSSWLDAPTLTPPDRPPVRQSVRPTNQKPDVDRQLPRERASDAKDFSRSKKTSSCLTRNEFSIDKMMTGNGVLYGSKMK